MNHNLKRWIYLVERDKQKRNIFLLLIFIVTAFFVFFLVFPDIKENNKEMYKIKWMHEKIDKDEIYSKIVNWSYNVDDILFKINESKKNLLYSSDSNNFKYIEDYISQNLVKYWQQEFNFWNKNTFINKWTNTIKIDLVFTNKDSLISLLNEFNNDWYLWRTTIQKEWLLYKSKLELTFNIN